MDIEVLKAARDRLRVRVPASADDAAELRAEVRAADAAIGDILRAAAASRHARALEPHGGHHRA